MDAQLEVKLIECLDALAEGESVEHILARYPQQAAQLRPLLRTAAGLSTLRMEPSEAVKMRARQKFMAQAAVLRHPAQRKGWAFWPRFATGFVAAGLVAIVLSTGVVAASGSSLPGDPLYGIKRTVENVRLSTSGSPVMRDELQHEFEQRRRDEANKLLDAGRESEVELTGSIESIQPNSWIVGGLAVGVNAETSIRGTPRINRLAEVKGMTGPGGLRATSITIESSGEIETTPEAENTATPETEASTETPEPTSTLATHVAPTRPAKTPRPTVQPQPTDAPPPTATDQPVEVEFTGSVQSIDGASWNIDGTTISVTADTELLGSINLGQRVKVNALRLDNGQLIATRIEPIDGSGPGDGGGGDSKPKSTLTPEPTDNHHRTPEPTESHHRTPEPTESHNPTPEPTESHNPTPEATESHHSTPEPTKNHD